MQEIFRIFEKKDTNFEFFFKEIGINHPKMRFQSVKNIKQSE